MVPLPAEASIELGRWELMIGSGGLKIKDPARQRPNTIGAEHHPANFFAAQGILFGNLLNLLQAGLIKPKMVLQFKPCHDKSHRPTCASRQFLLDVLPEEPLDISLIV